MPDARQFEMRIDIQAPPERVWAALTQAEELMRWFPPLAKVEPGVGGQVFISWGDAWSGGLKIEVWEPNRHLRLIDARDKPWSVANTDARDPARLAVDYFLEGKGGGTTLRLVHSGFGNSQGWDDEFDSISNGWKFELRGLRHYLTRHLGQDRKVIFLPVRSHLSRQKAYDLLAGPQALNFAGTIAGLKEGDRYALKAGDMLFAGRVLVNNPPASFAGTVENLDDAILRVEIERAGEGSGPMAWMSLWGKAAERAPELENLWRGLFAKWFPSGA